MGCPVPKVCKTGAGAALLEDPFAPVAVAQARRGQRTAGDGQAALRQRPGDLSGLEVARRLVARRRRRRQEHPPGHASQRHQGAPNYQLVRPAAEELPVPVLVSGGLQTAEAVRTAFERTGAAGVLLARGSLGNPWLFEQVLGVRDADSGPDRDEILDELDWVLNARLEHLGPSARRDTCASSTPGISSVWAAPATSRRRSRRPCRWRRRSRRHGPY